MTTSKKNNIKKHILNERALKERFLFIHINKTAGSSLEKALGLRREHKTALEKIKEIGIERWRQCFTFTIIRNPWDKVVSHYCYRRKTNQTGISTLNINFNDWIDLTYKKKNPQFYDKPKMFMPNSDWIANASGDLLVDKICRFEALSDDFNSLCQTLGKVDIELPHLLQTDRMHYSKYYTDVSASIVERHFKKDIANFGYTFR